MRKNLYILLGFIFGGFFLYAAVKDISLKDLNYVLDHFNIWWVIPMMGCATLFFIFKAIRWKYILEPVYVAKTGDLYASIMVGSSVGYILSIYLGEVVRSFWFAKQSKQSKSFVLATVLLERLFDLLILLLFFAIALIFSPELPFNAKKVGYLFTFLGALLSILMLFAVFKTESCLQTVHRLSRWLPEHLQKGMIKQVDQGITGLHSLKRPDLLLAIVATSLISWMFMAMTNHLAMVVVGVDAPLSASFLIMGLIVIGMSLPNPPGNIGIIEWCYVVALKLYGVDPSAAFAAAVVFHFFLYSGVITVGLFYARRRHLTLHQIADRATSEENKS